MKAVLQNVVTRSTGKNFNSPVLADRSRHENKRDVGRSFFCLCKGKGAVVSRQVIVTEYYLGGKS